MGTDLGPLYIYVAWRILGKITAIKSEMELILFSLNHEIENIMETSFPTNSTDYTFSGITCDKIYTQGSYRCTVAPLADSSEVRVQKDVHRDEDNCVYTTHP